MLQTAGWAGAGHLSKTVTGFINMLLVAHLGIHAILIVTCTFMVTLIYLAIDQQFRSVTTPLISQCTSEKKEHLPKSLEVLKARCKETEKQTMLVQTITVQALWFSMTLGFLVGGLALVFPSEILQLTGASNSVALEGAVYCQVMIGSIWLLSLSGTMEGTLEGIGHANHSAQAGILRNGSHLLLSIGGIYLLDMGVVGVACASVMGEVVGLIYMTYFLRKTAFQKKLASLRPNWNVQKDVIHSALPLMADMMFYQMNAALLWYILRSYGDVVFASQRIAAEVMAIPSAIFWGFYVSVTRFVPHAYGNSKYNRVKQYTTSMLKAGILTACVTLSGVLLFGEQIARLFTDDPRMITTTHQWIFIYLLVGVAGVIYNVIARALKGIQENKIIMWSSIISNLIWCIFMIIAWKYMSLWAVAATYVMYQSLEAAIVGWYFYANKWHPSNKKAKKQSKK
jgi:putative MATE family efflux protein